MGKTIGLHAKQHQQNTAYNYNPDTSNFNMNNNPLNRISSIPPNLNNNNNPPNNTSQLEILNTPANRTSNNLLNGNSGRSKHVAAMEAQAADMDALVKARHFAFSQKRTMPPRVSPLGILLIIMTGGLIFIGLTITIVANWPGLATIGENRLKIAGPILLVFGILGCVIVSCGMGWWANKKNRKWERDMTERAHKHISQSQEPIMDSSVQSSHHDLEGRQRRVQGITDGRLKFGRGVGEGRMVVGGLPIKTDGKTGTNETEEGSIPDPHRKQKQHRMLRMDSDWSAGSTNPSFSAGEADMNIPGISFTHSPDQSGVRVITKTTKTTTTKKVKRVAKEGSYGDSREDPIRDVLSGNGKRLKVLIKAQQGTAVKISPSPTPPTGRHHVRRSMDTEI